MGIEFNMQIEKISTDKENIINKSFQLYLLNFIYKEGLITPSQYFKIKQQIITFKNASV